MIEMKINYSVIELFEIHFLIFNFVENMSENKISKRILSIDKTKFAFDEKLYFVKINDY